MTGLKHRLNRLEQRRPGTNLPRIGSFPFDGMTEQEIEGEIARQKARGPLSDDEWAEKHGVETVDA